MMSTTAKSTSEAAGTSAGHPGSLPVSPVIEVVSRQRSHRIDRRRAASLARAVLDAIGESAATLSVIFVRDRRMRELNREWRGIDLPTDVLSFAYHEVASEDEGPPVEGDDCRHLGDLVISVETAERYAERYGISFEREIDQLVIHGALHLAGYDHETDRGQMSRLEKRLRRSLLADPDGADGKVREQRK